MIPIIHERPVVIVIIISITEYVPLAMSDIPKRKSQISDIIKNQKMKRAIAAYLLHGALAKIKTIIKGITWIIWRMGVLLATPTTNSDRIVPISPAFTILDLFIFYLSCQIRSGI